MKRTVVIGFLGTTLDAGKGEERWSRWRPTVALCQHEDFLIHRLELIREARFTALGNVVAQDIAQISPETEVRTHEVNIRDPWDFEQVYGALHDFARAYQFDTEAEDYLIHITTGTHVAQICMYLLTEAHYFPGRLLQLSPPRPLSGSQPGSYSIIDLDLSKYDRIASRYRAEQVEGTSFLKSGIETRNLAFNRMIDEIERVAIRSKAPLLLTGPTGAGKSQLARRIFELKKARHQVPGNFIEVNCATLRGDAAMSTLFGHVKGAFTGAIADRAGLLRAADKGVLFLDEIGELGLDEQAMMLRAIEEKRFFPVGSDREVESEFQLIAGTNRDLNLAVRDGRFREDLLARLNLWTFRLPGLRERKEDIEPNLEFELHRHANEDGRSVSFSKEARRRYLDFATSPEAEWSANFRDLGASVARMTTLALGGRITEDVVKNEIYRLRAQWHTAGQPSGDDFLAALIDTEKLAQIDPFDRVQLAAVLNVCRSCASLSAAGRRLFAASRLKRSSSNDADRLRKYLARFGLDWSSVHAGSQSN
ncbi:RNA repair transcriptional activator RtcR [Dongia deserti]|uniref:RNA repair transcriptional activator RtcR n=1 Tax=Dongia deserti TaxID=2268030 RepID=UPI000E64F0A4|nr:RNA repair transcriptional activator RtcR [Dongia deserti]